MIDNHLHKITPGGTPHHKTKCFTCRFAELPPSDESCNTCDDNYSNYQKNQKNLKVEQSILAVK